MNIGAIPTENMYKFMAISGLVIVLFSTTALYNWTNEAYDRASKSLLTVKLLRAEIDLYVEKRQRAIESGQLKNTTEKDYEIELREKFLPQMIRIEDAHEESKRDLIRMRFLYIMGILANVTGCLLSIIGFRLWYVRIQQFQDFETAEKYLHAHKKGKENQQESMKQENTTP